MLHGVYGDFLHNNNMLHLYRVVLNNAVYHCCWHLLVAQLASLYATPFGVAECWFTYIMAVEWKVVPDRSWNSKRPLVFTQAVLTKTLGIQIAR